LNIAYWYLIKISFYFGLVAVFEYLAESFLKRQSSMVSKSVVATKSGGQNSANVSTAFGDKPGNENSAVAQPAQSDPFTLAEPSKKRTDGKKSFFCTIL
jgi:hypothetical protein